MDANMTRGEEINFAIQSCDSFLSTATSSTYAFWMAYLMPEINTLDLASLMLKVSDAKTNVIIYKETLIG
uniref:Cytochrome P450 n=1 Tax=Meloidogyne hapla TaxID=6305 RepID=A0A1I8BVY0_MELHA